MSAAKQLILGIDGGGTKTVACLAQISLDGEQTILGRGNSGSSNLKAVGPEKALQNLLQALQQAWSATDLAPEPVSLAVLGMSGAGRPEAQVLMQQWNMEYSISQRFMLVHDALPVLAAGTPQGHGVALIAGTGSVAFAADQDSNTAVAGGWGYWFGDEGGAYWLGQAALRAVSQADDGRILPTRLTKAILDRMALSEPREMLTALSQRGDVRSEIAGLADLVTEAADQQDLIALQILDQAAEQLAGLVVAATQKLALGNTFSLAMAGGVLCGSQLLRDTLLKKLALKDVLPDKIEMVTDPVQGCLKLARRELATNSREQCQS
ncbi:N-acetylglucosamine kinase [Bythopirellula polymerisocia]|uniref:Glucosamine kinase GspK n=1 Tax=Bythopirellula polymerisocia TaxID=2528003 RepID=A0A5C6CG76_9BACT|nr:BadF/BadG/BcrA/BcrD ATPase family protein [Bythopirellula polymerisocia]TWU23650.1 Glucosamine kinase GspK [Bythopirellula polymerisocia]